MANIKTFKEYTEWGTDEDVRDKVSKTPGQKLPFEEITEDMLTDISALVSRLTHPKDYSLALDALEKILQRKTDTPHDKLYYSAQVAKSHRNIDAKQLKKLHDIMYEESIAEANYKGNIGAMELFKFYQVAKEAEKNELKKLIQAKKTKDAWQLIQKITGMKLQGAEFGN